MKRNILISGFIVLAILLGLYVGYHAESLYKSLFHSSTADNIFFTAGDDSSYYSIVNSRTEILHINLNGTRLNTIIPKKPASYCINGVLVDSENDSLYVWCTYFDETGNFIALEEILHYSTNGKLLGLLYTQEHESTEAVPVSGRIKSLCLLESGNIGVAYTTETAINTFEIEGPSGSILRELSFPFDQASHAVYDVNIKGNIGALYFSTKQGGIYTTESQGQNITRIYDIGPTGIFVPSKLHALPDGSILVREAFHGNIVKITQEGYAQVLLSATDAGLEEITSFFVQDDTLIISDNTQIQKYRITENGLMAHHTVSQLQFSLFDRLKSYVIFALVILCLGVIFYFAGKLIRKQPEDNRQIFKQILIISMGLTITVAIISYYVFNTLDERIEEANYNLLMIHLEYLSKVLDVPKVEGINNVSQFGSDDFNEIIAQLNQSLTINGSQNHSMYVGILKYIEDKTVILTYHDMDEFFFTPAFSKYQINKMYIPAFEEGVVVQSVSDDAEGRWQYVFGPIRNDSGEIIAIAEIGFDLTPYEEANRELFTNLLLKLLSILVIIMLLFVEFTLFDNKVLSKKGLVNKCLEDERSIAAGSVRAVSVLLFTGIFLTSTFMPIYSEALYANLLDIPKDIVIALPIVTESVFLILSILCFGRLKLKTDYRSAILAGGSVYALGSILTAFANSTSVLILTRAFAGTGYGIVYIALRTYIAASDEQFSNEELIAYGAGMTCGVCVGGVMGSIIADFIGFRLTFYVVAALVWTAAFIAWRILQPRYIPRQTDVKGYRLKEIKNHQFILNQAIVVYYFFEFLPSAICGSFLLFFLPLLAARLGYSTTLVGQIFLLNALCAIYAGPVLTRITTKALGAKNSLILAAFIYAGAIFLMAFNTNSIAFAAVCAIIIGLADSFKETQEADYFLDLEICRKVGEARAVSAFGIFECTGEAIGPLVYALILSMGISHGLMVLGASLPLTILIFAIGVRKPIGTGFS